jgi:pyruvate,water dikinase
MKMIAQAITTCRARGRKIGICGQAPSDYPEFVKFLVEHGIDSISLSPDTVMKTRLAVLEIEATLTHMPAHTSSVAMSSV